MGDEKSLIVGHKTPKFDENRLCQVLRASGHEYERLKRLWMAANGRKWPFCHSFRLTLEGTIKKTRAIAIPLLLYFLSPTST